MAIQPPLPDRHLDLGCGKFPRNPYQRHELFGLDIRSVRDQAFEIRACNLAVEKIPFEADYFGSISAFDFLEHLPRVMPTPDGRATRFPFIEAMNEIWRVLAPGGCLYALTPAYPAPEAFTDPTHVNIITEETHTYFSGENPLGRMYGFNGRFDVLRVGWVHASHVHEGDDAVSPVRGRVDSGRKIGGIKGFSRRLRGWSRRMRGKADPAHRMLEHSHLLWEFRAVKD